MHAVRQDDGRGDMVGVAGSLERGDDVVGIVRRVGKPGEDPIVEPMGFGERPLAARVRAALMRIEMFAGRAAELPDAGIGGALGMTELDRARRPVDGNACVPHHQRDALQNDIGVADLARLSEDPVADGKRGAQALVGKDEGGLCLSQDHLTTS